MENGNQSTLILTRPFVLRQLRDLGLFMVVAFIQSWIICPSCTKKPYVFALVISFNFLMWVFLWKGNSLLTNLVDTKISWVDAPVKRFAYGLIVVFTYTPLSVWFLMWFYEHAFDFNFGRGYYATLFGSVIVTMLISFFLHGREFLLHLRKALLDAERYQRESITAKYESLKNQVNPHFLFNSFNVLTNLVYEDQDKAVKFIKQLSDVYRYVLDSRDKEAVALDEELKFLNAYVFLQRIRFADKLNINLSLNNDGGYVAPLALQMLIENAIKHNVVSSENPLMISITIDNEWITVRNNLQRKTVMPEPSSGIGLENICKRYEFLTDRKVQIVRGEDAFVVSLPVLKTI